jgi:hypothetical protein
MTWFGSVDLWRWVRCVLGIEARRRWQRRLEVVQNERDVARQARDFAMQDGRLAQLKAERYERAYEAGLRKWGDERQLLEYHLEEAKRLPPVVRLLGALAEGPQQAIDNVVEAWTRQLTINAPVTRELATLAEEFDRIAGRASEEAVTRLAATLVEEGEAPRLLEAHGRQWVESVPGLEGALVAEMQRHGLPVPEEVPALVDGRERGL